MMGRALRSGSGDSVNHNLGQVSGSEALGSGEELEFVHTQRETLPAQDLLHALSTLEAHGVLPVSFSLRSPPACTTKHLPFKKNTFCFLASGPWHILFSGSPSLGSPLGKTLLKVLA